MNRIELKNVSKKFDDYFVLNNINYSFHAGNFYVIKGHSGCGKSTLLSLIGKLDNLTEGEILFDGKNVNDINEFVDKNISYIFQDNNLFLDLTVKENLSLVTVDLQLIENILERFNIKDKLNQKASLLSKGEKNRLVLSRIILEDKPVLLLDEPIGNLDEESAKMSFKILKEFSKNHLVIMVMHNDIDLIEYKPIILTIDNGNLKEVMKNQCRNDVNIGNINCRKRLTFAMLTCFLKSKINTNRFRTVFGLILQTTLLFLNFIIISFISADLNSQVVDNMIEANISQIQVFSDNPREYLYRNYCFKIINNEKAYNIDCLYSKNNKIEINEKAYNLKYNQLFISKSFVNSYVDIDLSKNFSLLDMSLDVSIIDADYSLISYNIVLNYAKNTTYSLNSEVVNDFLSASTEFIYDQKINLYNHKILPDYFDLTYRSKLENNEINIVVSRFYPIDFQDFYNRIINKRIILQDRNDSSLDEISNELVIKGLIINTGTNAYGIEVSEKFFDKFCEQFYEKGLLSSNGKNGYIITKEHYHQFNFMSNFNYYSNYLHLDENSVRAISSISSLKPMMLLILSFTITLNIIGIYFLINGYNKSFEKQKNLLFCIGFQKKDIIKINLLFYGFFILISILASMLLYFSFLMNINTLYYSIFDSKPIYFIFGNFSFNILYVLFIVIVLLFFSIEYKTKKNMKEMMKIMKSSLE